ncbi:MAG: ABC transporter substrate-binding protein [Acinetobacter sp.]|uniref:ABC transporter substrate-binding protein n=1 Tax=Acinetobacter sp. TaxID=472 RepID=UPI00258BAE24|nr:ABC transporter substrate-binding protein [Acinetobacter sp.]MCE1270657.1 ABC transporter substrate-binding protein [Acinetobacter sp.]
MAQLSKSKNLLWVLPVLALIVVLFLVFKPAKSTATPQGGSSERVSVIRIAVPDIGLGEKPSSGIPVLENIYLNKLLEKEFEKDHIKIEWQFFKGAGPAINEALINKQLDFAFLGDLGAIIGKANGIDTRILVPYIRHGHSYLAVQSGKGYKTLEDLKGKRIGVWQGTASQLSFNQFIAYHDLSEKDFRVVNLDLSAMNAALATKQIDAGWGSLGLVALEKKGLVDVIAGSRDTGTSLATIQTALVGTSSFIDQHPEVTQRIVNTVLKSAYWVSQPENHDSAIKQLTDNAKYPYDLYVESLKDQDYHKIFSPLIDQDYIQAFKQSVKSAKEAQLIRKDIEVEHWIDNRFVQQGIKELGYQQVWQPQN